MQKRQAAIRVIQRLNQWIHITNYWLEDVAICITNLKPDTTNVREWIIKPMRRQSKAKTESVLGIRHRDLVEYTYRNGETHRGYVTALYSELNALNFQSPTKHCKKVNAKKCRLIWKYSKIYWLENIV